MLITSTTGLLVVDIQGKLARLVEESEPLIANTARLVQGARALGLPVIWLEQNPDKLGATVPELQPLQAGAKVLPKFSFGALGEPQVAAAIRQSGVSHWLVCGIEAHICVYQTVQGLLDGGAQVSLVVDAVSSRTAANKTVAVDQLVALGARLSSVEMCLYELLGDCRHPAFRQILALVR
ncbi:isochorismatase family protein [Aeromonas sp. sif2433]|uniref:isochorismatase family protein n=1 Tax=Aeromonas sp. sif2433 TaxID=2854794 RepID=UPI001C48108F|nr:isochorismatase family protein [Aeromonas sp. sif2433]MBV7414959.1 isochorismatase family protein [Aeromonas sp. sif2433]